MEAEAPASSLESKVFTGADINKQGGQGRIEQWRIMQVGYHQRPLTASLIMSWSPSVAWAKMAEWKDHKARPKSHDAGAPEPG